jgi:hypothetical protein
MKKIKMRFQITLLVRIILLFGGLVMSLSVQSQQSTSKQQTKPNIIIKGIIENYDLIKTQFAKDSYLQLIVIPPDGSYSGGTDSIGRLILESEYAKTKVTTTGTFTFQIDNIKPGTYDVIAQLLKNRSYTASVPFLWQNSDFLKIEIKENLQLPIVIDIGKCTIKDK